MPRVLPATGWPRSAHRPRAARPPGPHRPGLVLVPTDLVASVLLRVVSRPRRAMGCTSRRTSRKTAYPPPRPPPAGEDPNGWPPVYALARAVSTLPARSPPLAAHHGAHALGAGA